MIVKPEDIENPYEFKICPTCNEKFSKLEYARKKSKIYDLAYLERDWKRKKYCSYECGNKAHQITQQEKINLMNQIQLKISTPIEIWEMKKGKITKIKVKLFEEENIYSLI